MEQRRKRGDLIEVFKLMHGLENVDRTQFFKLSREKHPDKELRGHKWDIWKPRFKKDRRLRFFDYRIIVLWNALPAEVVCKQAISSFKEKLDSHLKSSRGGSRTSIAP